MTLAKVFPSWESSKLMTKLARFIDSGNNCQYFSNYSTGVFKPSRTSAMKPFFAKIV